MPVKNTCLWYCTIYCTIEDPPLKLASYDGQLGNPLLLRELFAQQPTIVKREQVKKHHFKH